MKKSQTLSDTDRALYEWQMWLPGLGEAGQHALKNASVLVSRCGGVGGTVALYLASAGIGRLILAHAGNLKHSDLNRQVLMRRDCLGKPRVECAANTLRQFNSDLVVEVVNENICESNAAELVKKADFIVDCAPLFEERFLLNREAVRQRKPMVESAMYGMEARITTIVPGSTPCLECLYPVHPEWKREFPVLGAVSGTAACLGAIEAIKLIVGNELGEPLLGRMLVCDLRSMHFKTLKVRRDAHCKVCGGIKGV